MPEKRFKIPGDQIKRLIPNMGGCFASDRVTVDGIKVGYMYREEPDKDLDSGWRFFSETRRKNMPTIPTTSPSMPGCTLWRGVGSYPGIG